MTDVFNAPGHRIMFKHMRQLGMPFTFVDTFEQLYGVSTTDYIAPYGSTQSIDINRGTLHGDTPPTAYAPFSSNPSSDGSQSVAKAPKPLTMAPQHPHRPAMATDPPTPSASQRLPHQHYRPTPKALPLQRVHVYDC
jgi:hypothetical protein